MEQAVRLRSGFVVVGPLLLLAGLVTYPALMELGATFPLPRSVYLGMGMAGTLLIWFSATPLPRAQKGMLVAALLAMLACLHLVPWTSRKVFIQRFEAVTRGMPLENVDDLLGQYAFRGDATSGDTERAYYHCTGCRFDSDVGVVRFRDGLVVETRFVPD